MNNFCPIIKTECRIDCVAYTPEEVITQMSPEMGKLVSKELVRPPYCRYLRVNMGDTNETDNS